MYEFHFLKDQIATFVHQQKKNYIKIVSDWQNTAIFVLFFNGLSTNSLTRYASAKKKK